MDTCPWLYGISEFWHPKHRPAVESLVAHWLGGVNFEFWILNTCCSFLQAGAVEKIETNVQNLTYPNQWAVKVHYSQLPNKWVGWIKQVGWNFFSNLINK